ncbi:MAG TPA: hypothetical protein VGC92_16495 [Phenylobacterium sp.]
MLLFLRIYAVIYLVAFVEALAFAPARGMPSIVQLIDLIFFTPVAVVGLWSAAYRHLALPKHGWKVLLFASVFWRPFAVGNAVLSGDAIPRFRAFLGGLTAKMSGDVALLTTLAATAGLCFLGSLVILPPLIALYRNAYGDESLLKLMSPRGPRVTEASQLAQQHRAEVQMRRATTS